MAETTALLSYRERVVQERQRIASLMAKRPATEQAQWAQVKHTRRFNLRKGERLLAWDASQRVGKFALDLVEGHFDLDNGLTVKIEYNGLYTKNYLVGIDPVHIKCDVFVALDSLEPFTGGSDSPLEVRLLVFSGAGHEGSWPEGTAVGTATEFHNAK